MNASLAPETAPRPARIVVVDVLRAFALLGIIITHSVSGFLAGPTPDPDFNEFTPLDRWVSQLENLLTFGKFFTIFSFLFGLSFAIQLSNAAQKGMPFAGRFAWRLMVLLAIGFVHGLFFSGDVLVIYALLGLLLIPCRKLSDRTLLITGSILVLNIPMLLLGLAQVSAPVDPAADQARAAQVQQFMEMAQHQFDLKQSGTLAEVIALNLGFGLISKLIFMVFSGRLWVTFGLFLLGLYAGRRMIFRDTQDHRALFRSLLLWAGVVALITTLIAIVKPTSMDVRTLADVLAAFSFSVQQASLSAFYMAAVTLWFWRHPQQGWLPKLAPAGKMGLTTYLTQSAFGLVVFYGFGLGLLGKLGVAASVGLAIVFFVFQVLFAQGWLRRFNLGPFEWLWRSLTYFTLQPNARAGASTA